MKMLFLGTDVVLILTSSLPQRRDWQDPACLLCSWICIIHLQCCIYCATDSSDLFINTFWMVFLYPSFIFTSAMEEEIIIINCQELTLFFSFLWIYLKYLEWQNFFTTVSKWYLSSAFEYAISESGQRWLFSVYWWCIRNNKIINNPFLPLSAVSYSGKHITFILAHSP